MSYEEPPLPFAFSNAPHPPLPEPINSDSTYPGNSFLLQNAGNSMLLQHVHEEIPPDDSQLESQSMNINEEYEDSDDDEAPNDLMIEMNPLLHAETHNHSPNRSSRLNPARGAQSQRSSLLPRFPMDAGRRLEELARNNPLTAAAAAAASRTRHRRANGVTFNEPVSEADTKEKMKTEVLKLWSETENLDDLLQSIYDYFTMKGFTAILLGRATNLSILAFIVGFSVFLSSCVDYSLIGPNKVLFEVIRNDCVKNIHGLPATVLVLFSIWWVWQVVRLVLDTPKLFQLKLFYELILEIPESAMDTLNWREVVMKLMRIKDIPNSNPQNRPGLEKLDAHNIANRILRKENYLIAIFNKEILDLTVPIIGKRQIITKIMEWNLSFCILSYVFNEKGEVRKRFLKSTHRYAEEYSKNPSSIGARQYSPFAWWKFREFNELPHLYQERLKRSYEKANHYMGQFPKEKIIILARFVSFITGSFAAVLALLTLVDKQFMEFEITPQRSVFFYIGVFGGLATVARAMIPEENEIYEPERAIRLVAEDTHYLPESWKGKLHSEEVKGEFATLFDYKVSLFLQEILSVLLAPFILYYSLPKCSGDIIDFFREFTVHVDSLGYVCSFAVFNFRIHGNTRYGAPIEGSSPRLQSKEGKMEQSFLFFKANNPEWEPDHEGSQYVQNISRAQRNYLNREGSTSAYQNSVFLRPPRRNAKIGQSQNIARPVTESMMLGSDIDVDDRQLGLFGLLDAIYESNGRGFLCDGLQSPKLKIQDLKTGGSVHSIVIKSEVYRDRSMAELNDAGDVAWHDIFLEQGRILPPGDTPENNRNMP
ncbi:autophagy protein atg9 [Phlyctochytrium planicorne]|nr:autophagy protein atg9 [Phlyctochytrium planicorne]